MVLSLGSAASKAWGPGQSTELGEGGSHWVRVTYVPQRQEWPHQQQGLGDTLMTWLAQAPCTASAHTLASRSQTEPGLRSSRTCG